MKCPQCTSSDCARIVYGLVEIDPEFEKELDSGKVTLGGCCVTGNDPSWKCNSCLHRWGRANHS